MTKLSVPDDFEELIVCKIPGIGLHVILCIDSTVLGPALGGTRVLPVDPSGKTPGAYLSIEDAENDAKRLARGMTRKTAQIWQKDRPEYKLGGGKAVLLGDPKTIKTPKLLSAYGEFIDDINGRRARFYTGEDMNMTVPDVEQMNSRFGLGKSSSRDGSGNPAPMTALGCIWGQRAAMQIIFGSRKHLDKKLIFQGLGEVGFRLARFAQENGATIIGCDVDQKKVRRATDELGVTIVDPEDIFDIEGDIFVPCAGGGILNDETIPRIRCPIIAGPANNQLADPDTHGRMILERGLIYVPDYVINAGGLINVAGELAPGGYDKGRAERDVEKIYTRVFNILREAEEKHTPPHEVADQKCKKRIALVQQANDVS